MTDFKPGDVVRLKSNPQKMIVERFDCNNKTATCVWIEDYGVPHRETYIAEVLMHEDGENDRKIKKAMKRKDEDDMTTAERVIEEIEF